MRTHDLLFNNSWVLFFGTHPPGTHPYVIFRKGDRKVSSGNLFKLTEDPRLGFLGPGDRHVSGQHGVDGMHGSG